MLKFDINILWTLINLVILFVLMRFVLFNPIKKVLAKRNELIENQFKAAQEKEDNANKLLEDYQSQLDGVGDEKKQLIIEAKADARAEYNSIIEKAHKDADRIISDARKTVNLERKQARLEAKEEIASLAMEAAAKIVGSHSSAELDKKYYDEFLNESCDNE